MHQHFAMTILESSICGKQKCHMTVDNKYFMLQVETRH